MPAITPVTSPEEFMVATLVVTLLHMPPISPVGSLNTVVVDGHTFNTPDIAPWQPGSRFTNITAVAATVPQLLVTV